MWQSRHHIVCECPAIKSIRVRLYGKPLLLPEEVMEEPLWKIAMVQWAKPKCQVSLADPQLEGKEEEEVASRCKANVLRD